MNTPHSVDARHTDGPLLNIVVYNAEVTMEEIAERLGAPSGGIMLEDVAMKFRVVPGSIWGPGESRNTHAWLSPEPARLDNIVSQVQIAVVDDGGPMYREALQYREPRLHQLRMLRHVTALACAREDAVAAANSRAMTPIFVEKYGPSTLDDELSTTIAAVWVMPNGDRFDVATSGLTLAGHPELQAFGLQGDPQQLYATMLNLTEYVLGQCATLREGDPVSGPDGAQVLRVGALQPSMLDPQRPALQLEFL